MTGIESNEKLVTVKVRGSGESKQGWIRNVLFPLSVQISPELRRDEVKHELC